MLLIVYTLLNYLHSELLFAVIPITNEFHVNNKKQANSLLPLDLMNEYLFTTIIMNYMSADMFN